jgi:hypothetical protein
MRLKAKNNSAAVTHAATLAHLLRQRPTTRRPTGAYRYFDDSPSAKVTPCATPSRTEGGFSSSAALITSAMPKMPDEIIRLSGTSRMSYLIASKLTKGATWNRTAAIALRVALRTIRPPAHSASASKIASTARTA